MKKKKFIERLKKWLKDQTKITGEGLIESFFLANAALVTTCITAYMRGLSGEVLEYVSTLFLFGSVAIAAISYTIVQYYYEQLRDLITQNNQKETNQ